MTAHSKIWSDLSKEGGEGKSGSSFPSRGREKKRRKRGPLLHFCAIFEKKRTESPNASRGRGEKRGGGKRKGYLLRGC